MRNVFCVKIKSINISITKIIKNLSSILTKFTIYVKSKIVWNKDSLFFRQGKVLINIIISNILKLKKELRLLYMVKFKMMKSMIKKHLISLDGFYPKGKRKLLKSMKLPTLIDILNLLIYSYYFNILNQNLI